MPVDPAASSHRWYHELPALASPTARGNRSGLAHGVLADYWRLAASTHGPNPCRRTAGRLGAAGVCLPGVQVGEHGEHPAVVIG